MKHALDRLRCIPTQYLDCNRPELLDGPAQHPWTATALLLWAAAVLVLWTATALLLWAATV